MGWFLAYLAIKNGNKKTWMILSILAFLMLQPALGLLAFTNNFLQVVSANAASYLSQLFRTNISPANFSGNTFTNLESLQYQLLTIMPMHVNNMFQVLVLGVLCLLALYIAVKFIFIVHTTSHFVTTNNSMQNAWICFDKPFYAFVKPNEKITA